MRILFIHEVNWQQKVTFEIHELPELLSCRGHLVDFVDFPEGEVRRGLRALIDTRTDVSTVVGRTISGSSVRVITPGRVFVPPFDRFFASVTLIPLLARLLRQGEYDAIFLYGVPTNGWQATFLARWYGVPILFRGIDVAHCLRKTKFSLLVRAAERYVYRNANHISVNNLALQDYCIKEGARRDAITVEYPGLDRDHFRIPQDTASLKHLCGIQSNDRVITYMGTFFRFSGLVQLIEGFVEVRKKEPGLKLLLIGDGELREKLEEITRRNGLEDCVIFTGVVDYRDLPRYMQMATVAVVPFIPSLVSNKALPWKVVQYVSANLPVVSTRLEGLMGLFPEGQGVTYSDGDKLWDNILMLLNDENFAHTVVKYGQEIVEEYCDWGKNIEVFESLLHTLSSASARP